MDRPIVIDSHVHFWDPARLRYPWLDELPALRRPRLPADYDALTDGSVDGVVVVEANCAPEESVAEVAFVQRLAAAEPRIVAMIAYVDLLDERHRDAALDRLTASGRVVGVRQNIQGLPGSICHDDVFVRGVQQVGGLGLTFDLCARASQLADVAELVRRCPDTRFVLDHCGKPEIEREAFGPWAASVARIAANGDVCCKLSGLLTEARPDQRTYDALLPYADHVLASFGTSRLMYGSDWPVVDIAGGTSAWRAFTDRLTSSWSPAERRRVYADTALRFYGVPMHAES
ncbi:MAG: amidohydrolase family protein [Gemmatimonadaceae bacterium]